MAVSVFDFQDYKAYLAAVIEEETREGRGYRTKLAEAAGVQLAFLYQVLSKKTHFNLEHADRLNDFLKHTPEMAHYFLLQVQYARAGTEKLKTYFRTQMQTALNHRLQLKNRFKNEGQLTNEDLLQYYSAWYYGAVRVATAIPELQTAQALKQRFGLSDSKLRQVLEFLVTRGLIIEKKDRLSLGTAVHTHLGDENLLSKHHTNWRLRAMASIDEKRQHDVHYSSVAVISQEDAVLLKAKMVEFITDVQKQVAPSKEETLYSFSLDFFEL